MAEPVILATVLCRSHHDFRLGEAGRGDKREISLCLPVGTTLYFSKGWMDLKYSVIFAECFETLEEGLILPRTP